MNVTTHTKRFIVVACTCKQKKERNTLCGDERAKIRSENKCSKSFNKSLMYANDMQQHIIFGDEMAFWRHNLVHFIHWCTQLRIIIIVSHFWVAKILKKKIQNLHYASHSFIFHLWLIQMLGVGLYCGFFDEGFFSRAQPPSFELSEMSQSLVLLISNDKRTEFDHNSHSIENYTHTHFIVANENGYFYCRYNTITQALGRFLLFAKEHKEHSWSYWKSGFIWLSVRHSSILKQNSKEKPFSECLCSLSLWLVTAEFWESHSWVSQEKFAQLLAALS